MTEQKEISPRRTFLLQAAGFAGAGSLGPLGVTAAQSAGPAQAPEAMQTAATPYQSLSPDEATFIEALVNVLCPADEYSPCGVDCGLAIYIDRQLAGPYGKGDGRYLRGPFREAKPELGLQSPLTPEQLCKAGIVAANAASTRDRGRPWY